MKIKIFLQKLFAVFQKQKHMLTEHKEVCLSIHGAKSVRLEKGTIQFKSYFKQRPIPLKSQANFDCNLNIVESYEGSYSKKYEDHVRCNFAYKFFVLVINLPS